MGKLAITSGAGVCKSWDPQMDGWLDLVGEDDKYPFSKALRGMKNYFTFLAITFSSLCCNNTPSNSSSANIYTAWDLIYLDISNTRYIVNSMHDSLIVSKFHFEEAALQTGGSISKRGLDTTYAIPIQTATKKRLVTDVLEVFKNPVPSTSSVTDHAGQSNLCLVKGETYLCYSFSNLDNLQPELREVIDFLKQTEGNMAALERKQ
jgi:hypothetical protein